MGHKYPTLTRHHALEETKKIYILKPNKKQSGFHARDAPLAKKWQRHGDNGNEELAIAAAAAAYVDGGSTAGAAESKARVRCRIR